LFVEFVKVIAVTKDILDIYNTTDAAKNDPSVFLHIRMLTIVFQYQKKKIKIKFWFYVEFRKQPNTILQCFLHISILAIIFDVLLFEQQTVWLFFSFVDLCICVTFANG
jgi:hypothetical protein